MLNHCRKTRMAITLAALLPAVSYASTELYMPLGDGNGVAVVNAETGSLEQTIPGVEASHGLAVSPDGRYLVAGSLMEKASGKLPPKPAGVSQADHEKHHSMGGGVKPAASQTQGMLYILDAVERKVLRTVDVPGAIHHNLVTRDGRFALSTHPGRGGISVVDIEKGHLVREISTGPVPNYIVSSPDGKSVFVSNAGNNTISEIDTENWIVSRNILAGQTPEHMLLTRDGESLFAVNVAKGEVSRIDLPEGKIVASYSVGPEPHGIAISDDEKRVYVSSKGGNQVVEIEVGVGVSRKLELSPQPYHVEMAANKLYVSSRKEPKVWVVDPQQLKPVGEVQIKGVGHQMAVFKRD